MYLYIGATLHTFFENEKSAIRDLINVECDKYEGAKPPTPTRGIERLLLCLIFIVLSFA